MSMSKCKRERTPRQATAGGRRAVGLDPVYTDKFLKGQIIYLPVQPINNEPCKFCYIFTGVKPNANFKVY